MKHATALLIKLFMITIILEVVLLILSDLLFTDILLIAITTTIVAYLIGDLIIYPISNNTIATLSDIALTFVIIYMFNHFWFNRGVPFYSALIAAGVVGIGEIFFHQYVATKNPDDPE